MIELERGIVRNQTLTDQDIEERARELLAKQLDGNYTEAYLITTVIRATIEASRPQPTEGEK